MHCDKLFIVTIASCGQSVDVSVWLCVISPMMQTWEIQAALEFMTITSEHRAEQCNLL